LANTTASNNTAVGYQAGYSATGAGGAYFGIYAGQNATGNTNTLIGNSAGYLITSGAKNTVLGGYSGNQGGLDIRTASNYIVLSDGDGNPRGFFDNQGSLVVGANSPDSGTSSAYYSGFAYVNRGTTNSYAVVGHPSGTSSGNGFHVFAYNGSIIGSITQNGTTGVLFNTFSDYRLKDILKGLCSVYRGARALGLRSTLNLWCNRSTGSLGPGCPAGAVAMVPSFMVLERGSSTATTRPPS
jgi:hypothetical protein